MNATTNPCTKCRDNSPLPEALDFFDRIVIADYTQRRTACTAVPDAVKPCLQPAPAAEPTDDMGGLVRMDSRRQTVALDAAIELETLARLLPRLVPTDNGDNSHEAHYSVRGVAGRVLRLASVVMSALSDESEATERLERVLNLDHGQG